MKKQEILLILAILGILFGIYRVLVMSKTAPVPQPLHSPAVSPFPASVAASGIIEAAEENIQVQPQVSGLVKKIAVEWGQKVKAGDTLFFLENSAQKAAVNRLNSEVIASEAALKQAEASLENTKLEFQRKEALYKEKLITTQQYDDIVARVSIAEAEIGKMKALLKANSAARTEAIQRLSWHIVRAPKEGAILQINVRVGEWVMPGQATAPILMGRTDRLQIRADIDEVNAVEVQPNAKAIAYLRGYTEKYIPLEFVRIDPYIVPKRQLTGSNSERVDVRVLQVIYSFTIPDFPVYPGQQVDVFIESTARLKENKTHNP